MISLKHVYLYVLSLNAITVVIQRVQETKKLSKISQVHLPLYQCTTLLCFIYILKELRIKGNFKIV